MKILLCDVLLLALCLVPAGSVSEAPAHPQRTGVTASVRVKFSGPPFFEEREYTYIPEPDKSFGPDPDMVIITEANCDPDMLIPVEADCDPEFVKGRNN
ncbi:MAG: hypothetical protein GX936_03965 [Clostridiales bacterium]|jgi:hypothetical protein|nr:hypothetical protein [Clostridiales bacterium]